MRPRHQGRITRFSGGLLMRWLSPLSRFRLPFCTALLLAGPAHGQEPKKKLYLDKLDVDPPHISTDKSVKYDYDIVYVRARRAGDKIHKRYYTDFSSPVT